MTIQDDGGIQTPGKQGLNDDAYFYFEKGQQQDSFDSYKDLWLYGRSKLPKGLIEGLTDLSKSDIPVVGLGFAGLEGKQEYERAKRFEAGTQTWEDIVAQVDKQRPTTGGYLFSNIAGSMPGYMVDFALSGGAVVGAKVGVKAAAKKWAPKVAEKIAKTSPGVGKFATGAATFGTLPIVQEGLPRALGAEGGRITQRTYERAGQAYVDVTKTKQGFQTDIKSFEEALPQGVLDVMIENLSEFSGGLLTRALRVRAIEDAVGRWWRKKTGRSGRDWLDQLTDAVQFQGIVGEYLEEVGGAAMREGTSFLPEKFRLEENVTLKDYMSAFPNLTESAAMMSAFALFPVAKGAYRAMRPETMSDEEFQARHPKLFELAEASQVIPLDPDTGWALDVDTGEVIPVWIDPELAASTMKPKYEEPVSAEDRASSEQQPFGAGVTTPIKRKPKYVDVGGRRYETVPEQDLSKEARAARRVARGFGVALEIAETEDFGGVSLGGGRAVLSRAAADMGTRGYLYHEIVHEADRQSEGGIADLYSRVRAADPEGLGEARRRKLERLRRTGGMPLEAAQQASRELRKEETLATQAEDLSAYLDLLGSPEGAAYIQRIVSKDRGLIERIVDALRKMASTVFGGDARTKYQRDLDNLTAALRLIDPSAPEATAQSAKAAQLFREHMESMVSAASMGVPGAAEAVSPEFAEAVSEDPPIIEQPEEPRYAPVDAWHGGAKEFDKFSTDFIDTGEGAQAFGWGLYYADRREVGEEYRDNVSAGLFTPAKYELKPDTEADVEQAIDDVYNRPIIVMPGEYIVTETGGSQGIYDPDSGFTVDVSVQVDKRRVDAAIASAINDVTSEDDPDIRKALGGLHQDHPDHLESMDYLGLLVRENFMEALESLEERENHEEHIRLLREHAQFIASLLAKRGGFYDLNYSTKTLRSSDSAPRKAVRSGEAKPAGFVKESQISTIDLVSSLALLRMWDTGAIKSSTPAQQQAELPSFDEVFQRLDFGNISSDQLGIAKQFAEELWTEATGSTPREGAAKFINEFVEDPQAESTEQHGPAHSRRLEILTPNIDGRALKNRVITELLGKGLFDKTPAKRIPGSLYNVTINVEDEEFLLWDRPINEQPWFPSETAKEAAARYKEEGLTVDSRAKFIAYADNFKGLTGEKFYKRLAQKFGGQKGASMFLLSQGIKGVKFLDGASRRKGKGTYNYVIFDDRDVSIKERFAPSVKFKNDDAQKAWDLISQAEASESNVKHRVLYHSGTADPAEIQLGGVEPRFGDWLEEVLAGSTDEYVDPDDSFTPVAYYDDMPRWVRTQVERKLGKSLVTDDEIREHGYLAVVINDEEGEQRYNFYQVLDSQGEYSTVEDSYGTQQPLYKTELYEEPVFGPPKAPFGMETGDFITTDFIEPDVVLSGDALMEFMQAYKENALPKENRGEIVTYDNFRFAPVSGEGDLLALHNLTETSISHADRHGGLPMPSIAIVKEEDGPISGFGGITLIAPKSMIDPQGGAFVYDRDAYTPRHPKLKYRLKKREVQAIVDELAESLEFAGLGNYSAKANLEGEHIKQEAGRSVAFDYIKDDSNWRVAYAHSQGIKLRRFRLPKNQIKTAPQDRNIDPGIINLGIYDYGRMGRVAKRKTNQGEFESWINSLLDRIHVDPYVETRSGKKLPYSPESVVKAMQVRDPRGAESDNLTLGMVAAKRSQRLRDLSEIQDASFNIVPDAGMEDYIDDIQQPLAKEYLGLSRQDYKYSDTWRAHDNALMALSDAMKYGPITGKKLSRALIRYDFNKPSADTLEAGVKLGQALEQAPTRYFEAKPQRVVPLSEFAGAMVPKSAKEAIAILRRHGVPVRLYDDLRDNRIGALQKTADMVTRLGRHIRFAPAELPGSSGYKEMVEQMDSRLKSRQGVPKVLYHGTRRRFTSFAANVRTLAVDAFDQLVKDKAGDGLVFFSFDPHFASTWATQRSLSINRRQGKSEADYKDPSEPKREDYDSQEAFAEEYQSYLDRRMADREVDVNVMPVYVAATNIFDARKDHKKIEPFLKKLKPDLTVGDLYKEGNWLIYEKKEVVEELARLGYDAMLLAESQGGPHDTLAVWSPNIVKSAIGNDGAFNLGVSDIRYAPARDRGPAFYSAVIDFLQKQTQKTYTPKQLDAVLRKAPGVTEEELRWIDWQEFLDEFEETDEPSGKPKKITLEQAIEHVRRHRLGVGEAFFVKRDSPILELAQPDRLDPQEAAQVFEDYLQHIANNVLGLSSKELLEIISRPIDMPVADAKTLVINPESLLLSYREDAVGHFHMHNPVGASINAAHQLRWFNWDKFDAELAIKGARPVAPSEIYHRPFARVLATKGPYRENRLPSSTLEVVGRQSQRKAFSHAGGKPYAHFGVRLQPKTGHLRGRHYFALGPLYYPHHVSIDTDKTGLPVHESHGLPVQAKNRGGMDFTQDVIDRFGIRAHQSFNDYLVPLYDLPGKEVEAIRQAHSLDSDISDRVQDFERLVLGSVTYADLARLGRPSPHLKVGHAHVKSPRGFLKPARGFSQPNIRAFADVQVNLLIHKLFEGHIPNNVESRLRSNAHFLASVYLATKRDFYTALVAAYNDNGIVHYGHNLDLDAFNDILKSGKQTSVVMPTKVATEASVLHHMLSMEQTLPLLDFYGSNYDPGAWFNSGLRRQIHKLWLDSASSAASRDKGEEEAFDKLARGEADWFDYFSSIPTEPDSPYTDEKMYEQVMGLLFKVRSDAANAAPASIPAITPEQLADQVDIVRPLIDGLNGPDQELAFLSRDLLKWISQLFIDANAELKYLHNFANHRGINGWNAQIDVNDWTTGDYRSFFAASQESGLRLNNALDLDKPYLLHDKPHLEGDLRFERFVWDKFPVRVIVEISDVVSRTEDEGFVDARIWVTGSHNFARVRDGRPDNEERRLVSVGYHQPLGDSHQQLRISLEEDTTVRQILEQIGEVIEGAFTAQTSIEPSSEAAPEDAFYADTVRALTHRSELASVSSTAKLKGVFVYSSEVAYGRGLIGASQLIAKHRHVWEWEDASGTKRNRASMLTHELINTLSHYMWSMGGDGVTNEARGKWLEQAILAARQPVIGWESLASTEAWGDEKNDSYQFKLELAWYTFYRSLDLSYYRDQLDLGINTFDRDSVDPFYTYSDPIGLSGGETDLFGLQFQRVHDSHINRITFGLVRDENARSRIPEGLLPDEESSASIAPVHEARAEILNDALGGNKLHRGNPQYQQYTDQALAKFADVFPKTDTDLNPELPFADYFELVLPLTAGPAADTSVMMPGSFGHYDVEAGFAHVRGYVVQESMLSIRGHTQALGKGLFIEEVQSDRFQGKGKRQDAPFVKKWPTIAMKRMLKMAADGGMDYVAWTPGVVQVGRFSDELRGVVRRIKYAKPSDQGHIWDKYPEALTVRIKKRDGYLIELKVDEDARVIDAHSMDDWDTPMDQIDEFLDQPLSAVIGQGPADQILNSASEQWSTIEGDDLTVGGKGMTTFYDNMLVKIARTLAKRFEGAEYQYLDIDIEPGPDWEAGYLASATSTGGERISRHILFLTDEMREVIAKEGFTVFGPRFAPRRPEEEGRVPRQITPQEVDTFGQMRERAVAGEIAGRPDLAQTLTADGPEMQAAQTAVDEMRNLAGLPNAQELSEKQRQADTAVRANFDGMRAAILKKIRNNEPLSDVETFALREITNTVTMHALRTNDELSWRDSMLLNFAYRESGSQASRAFNARRSIYNKTVRGEQLVALLLARPTRLTDEKLKKLLREKAQETTTPSRREQIVSEIEALLANEAARNDRVYDALMRHGFDPKLITKYDWQDPATATRLIRIIGPARATFQDKVREFVYASMLSFPYTHIRNIRGNAINVGLSKHVQEIVESGVNLLVDDPDSPSFREALSSVKVLAPAMKQAGRNFIDAYKYERAAREAFDTGELDVNKLAEGVQLPAIGNKLYRYLLRSVSLDLLAAADDAFKGYVGVTAGAQYAYREAKAEGIQPGTEAFERRVRELINDAGTQAKVRNQALELTFQDKADPDSFVGVSERIVMPARTWLDDRSSSIGLPVGTMLLPFVRTPLRLLRETVRRSPAKPGEFLVKAVLAMSKGSLTGKYPGGQTKMVKDLADSIIASLLAWGVLSMLDEEDENGVPILGGAQESYMDPTGALEQQRAVRPAYTISIGGQDYSFKATDPIAGSIALIVESIEGFKRDGASGAGWSFGMTLLRNVKDQTYMQTVSDISELMNVRDSEDGASKLLRTAIDTFVTPLVPNIIKGAMRESDEVVRETKIREYEDAGRFEAMLRRLPYKLTGAALSPPPKYDVWGRPVKRTPISLYNGVLLERIISSGQPKKADIMLYRWRQKVASGTADGEEPKAWYPSRPKTYVTRNGKKIIWTDEEYAELSKRSGKYFDEQVHRLRLNWQDPKEKDIQAVDRQRKSAYRRAVTEMLRMRSR